MTTQMQAMEYVNKLLFGLQRARSISSENIEALASQVTSKKVSKKIAKEVEEDLLPWLADEKGKALLSALEKVSTRGSITGMEFYNFMFIIHRLSPVVNVMAGVLSETVFPEPDLSECREIGSMI